MAIELKQSLKLSQQLVMTPQLQQAIKLLQLSRVELVDLVQTEMLENPLLENPDPQAEEVPNESASTAPEVTPDAPSASTEADVKEVEPDKKDFDQFEWENYLGADRGKSSLPSTYEAPESLPTIEATLSEPTTLHDHLRWQMQMSDFNREEEKVGNMIVGNIDDNGYLKVPIEEIADKVETSVDYADDVLAKIQDFDPPGVGARDLKECLLIQSRLLEKSPLLGLVRKVIKNHLDLLTVRNYPALAKALGVNMERVKTVVKLIGEMEPKPGRPFTTENPQYITPDVYVYKVGNDYAIVLNEDGLPKLRISQFYQSALAKDSKASTKEYIQGKIRSAIWLIKSIHQRQRTVYKTTESIVKYQREFFDKGIAFLKPMILRDVAEDISMHESTISRVTTNKYVHTPHGIYELKFFFNSSIHRTDKEDLASEAVKSKIKKLITSENPRKPFSDQQIVEILSEGGIDIARRTVAKYRESMGLLSSSKRKRLF
jgi:RNA polymerase sigma-54 factor